MENRFTEVTAMNLNEKLLFVEYLTKTLGKLKTKEGVWHISVYAKYNFINIFIPFK